MLAFIIYLCFFFFLNLLLFNLLYFSAVYTTDHTFIVAHFDSVILEILIFFYV